MPTPTAATHSNFTLTIPIYAIRALPMLLRLSSLPLIQFVSVLPSTFRSSTMRSSIHLTVPATLPSKHSMTQLPSLTPSLRSRTAIVLSSCNFSVIISLFGPHLTAVSLRLLLARTRRSLPRKRLTQKKLRRLILVSLSSRKSSLLTAKKKKRKIICILGL